MSWWLQSAIEALEGGRYEDFRVNILPLAPIQIPSCFLRELEFTERRCLDVAKDQLFPIRFLWFMEAKEQQLFGLKPLGRSRYNPEKLLELWKRASTDVKYREGFEDIL